MKKSILHKVIAVALSATVLCGTGFTTVGQFTGTSGISVNAYETYGDFEYVLNGDNTITIIKYTGKGEDVVIPDTINANIVTSIGEKAFVGSWNLKSVKISDNVTEIGRMAFYGCPGLVSVIIGNGVTEIGERVFENCTSLTNVTIPDSVTEIGYHSFAGCTDLTDINISNSVTKIGYKAFGDCTGLTRIDIPDSVKYINGAAFKNCTSLTSVSIPDSVTEIGWLVFAGCTSLNSVKIGKGLEKISWNVFQDCKNLTSIIIPENVKEIGWNVFRNCENLVSIVIPDSVTVIGNGVFYGCNKLTIYGEKDSYTETYANKNRIPFISSISANEIVIGGTVTVNAKAVLGEGEYTYAVLYKKKTETKWTVKQDYSTNDTVTIKPVKATDYDICVKVKDCNGKIVKKFFTLKVNEKLKNTSTISATTIKKGEIVKLNGSATGGIGNYTYAVYYKQKVQTKWTTKQNFNANTVVSIKPAQATDYDICIKVKDKDGTISKKYFTVTVTK